MKRGWVWVLGLMLASFVILLTTQAHRDATVQAQMRAQTRLKTEISAVINTYVPAIDTGIIDSGRACKPLPEPSSALASLNPKTLHQALPKYTPREIWRKADPSNFGQRVTQDVHGKPVDYPLLVVLHETVGSTESAISLFQTYHSRDEDQVSYHALIDQDGTIVYIVPPENRAYGAGNSEFAGQSVKTNPRVASSVNNFSYHISLETPLDGMNELNHHSGYSSAQYQSLAWLVARTRVQPDRIVFHRDVDRDGERNDPRSFDQAQFRQLLSQYDLLYQADCSLLALASK